MIQHFPLRAGPMHGVLRRSGPSSTDVLIVCHFAFSIFARCVRRGGMCRIKMAGATFCVSLYTGIIIFCIRPRVLPCPGSCCHLQSIMIDSDGMFGAIGT